MGRYSDIINLPHHVSKNHRQMSIYDRSAQFAPFAALTGYEESISEASRYVDQKIELGIDKKEEIREKLSYLSSHLNEKKTVSIIYFMKDKKKDGGSYISSHGLVSKIDQDNQLLIIDKVIKIRFCDIIDICI